MVKLIYYKDRIISMTIQNIDFLFLYTLIIKYLYKAM